MVFLLLTLAAPTAMKIGRDLPGHALYKFFSKFCHQFAFRSWFLYGQQTHYPRFENGNLLSYGEMFGASVDDLTTASSILGNSAAGYKIAICQRDTAMYSALLVSGLIFALSGKKISKIPLWLWFVLGVLPLGIDGITQLSGTSLLQLHWLPVRESTPLIRTITGGLFGFISGWYIYPSLEENLSAIQNTQLRENKRDAGDNTQE